MTVKKMLGGHSVCAAVACMFCTIVNCASADGIDISLPREWTGAAGDGKFSNPANWQYNEVPPEGADVVICCNNAMTLDCDVDFKPRSITFSEDSELVTIGGNGTISDVYAITNNTPQHRHHVFNCPVSCKSDVLAKITLASERYMDFAGGITMTNLDTSENPKTYCGTFTVTTADDWNPGDGATLRSGSTLNLPNATYYDHNGRLTIESGATCRVMQSRTDGHTSQIKHLMHRNDGMFIADIEMFSRSRDGGGYWERNSGDGVFITKKLRAANNGILIPGRNMVLGSDGIVRGAGYVRLFNSVSHYFGSCDDWSMYYSGLEDSSDYILYKHNSTTPISITFDTADWYDKKTPHTIRCKAPVCGANVNTAASISMIVVGTGEFSFECSYDDMSAWKWFSGGLAVKDTATVRVKAGCKPGNGSVDMDGGTTLALPTAGTATVAFGGDFTVSGVGKAKIVLGNTNDVLSVVGTYTLLTATNIPDVSRLELVNRTVGEANFSRSVDGKTLFLTVAAPPDIVVDVGGGKSVAVPQMWLDEHPAIVAAAGGDRTAALQNTAANGRMSVVECYVVGLDPEKADEDFKITSFPMKADGTPDLANLVFDPPQAEWNVPGATPVVKGAATLDGEWQTVIEDNKAGFRFFKVVVEVP